MKKLKKLFDRQLFKLMYTLALIIWSIQSAHAQPPVESVDLETAFAAGSTARVVVALQSPAGVTVGLQLQDIAQTQASVLDELDAEAFKLVHRYATLPGLVGEVTAEGLEVLLRQPAVKAVALDLPVEFSLTESATLINADDVWQAFGLTGKDINVAVLDTGIDASHPDLAGQILAQHCFDRSGCPPEEAQESNNAQDQNGHGTHVAGIIAGQGGRSPQGIAPGAGLVAVRVLNAGGSGFTSDVLAGIDWVVAHQAQLRVSVINMSLGGGSYGGICDQADANTQLYAAAVENARMAGITLFAASGNSGLSEQMMAPACISGVVAVGSTYDTGLPSLTLGGICTDTDIVADQIACISNSSPALDLLAPGVPIISSALGGGQSSKSGTSMAAAHAAAVAALLLEANPALTPDELETVLKESGLPVTDGRNGRVTPRIDALAAVSQILGQEGRAVSGIVLLQGRTDHSGTEIFLSQEACSTALFGEPAATTGADGYFEFTTAGEQTYGCLQVAQAGYLKGRHDSPAGDLGRITLSGGDITGDALINIFDLAIMAGRYDSADAAADINADGWVDILDLIIAAGNYEQAGPLIWE